MYDKFNPFIYALAGTVGYVTANLIISRAISLIELALVAVLFSIIFYVDSRRAPSTK